jgi:solute:Na+ symporter, SSS family
MGFGGKMNVVDVIVIIIWVLISFIIGVLPGINTDFEGFWLNNKKTHLLSLVFTIVATQVGGGTIIGIASSTYKSGLGFGVVALISTVVGFLVIAQIAPKIKLLSDQINAHTLSEIIGYYYGAAARKISGVVIVFSYFALLASQVVAIMTFIKVFPVIDYEVILYFVGITLVLYCGFAGLRGDIASDIFHFWGMLIFYFIIFLPFVLINVDLTKIIGSLTWYHVSPVRFGGYAYLVAGILFGAIVPLVSMEMWLRIFASENADDAKKAYRISSLVVVPFYLFAMIVGLISIVNIVGISNPDDIIIKNYIEYLPQGLLGLGIAGLLSVTLSTANTYVVVLSATIYRDILNIKKEDKVGLLYSRITTLLIGGLGVFISVAYPDVVSLIIGGFFFVLALFPALLFAFIKGKINYSYAGVVSIVSGFLVTLVSLKYMGNQAFIPGLLASFLGYYVGGFIGRKEIC